MDNNLNFSNKNLKFYVKNFKNIILLSKDEEYILTKKFKEKNDLSAVKKLVESNLSYVIKIARSYTNYKITVKDLVQEGIIGLIKAIKKFDPDRRVRLISFAIFWIKSEIHEYIIKNLRIVRIASTKSQKKIFFNLKKFKKLKWLSRNELITISNLLNIKKKDVEYMESKLSNQDLSIENVQNDDNKEEKNIKEIKYIYFNNDDPMYLLAKSDWKSQVVNNLKKALEKLDDRSKLILIKRWLQKKKHTLKKLANKNSISSERIRQLENYAIKNLKDSINIEN